MASGPDPYDIVSDDLDVSETTGNTCKASQTTFANGFRPTADKSNEVNYPYFFTVTIHGLPGWEVKNTLFFSVQNIVIVVMRLDSIV